MLHQYANALGLILLLVGIMGTMPALKTDDMLFGIFMVDTFHNLFHMISGVILLIAGFNAHWEVTRRTVLAFAAVYGLLTVMGFLSPDGVVLGMPMNMADNVLHLTITAVSLIFALPVQRYTTLRR